MRRTTTFTAALAVFGWAAVFAIAQGQQELPWPPTFTAPYSGQTTGPDHYQGPSHAQTAPVPVTGPMILQLGPPPTMYSPSADFKARVAALAFDDCAASVPPPCPPPSCVPPITGVLPNGAQFTSDGSVAAPAVSLPIPPLSAVQIYSSGPPNPFYVAAAPPPIAGLVCDCDGHCQTAQAYTAPSPTQMVWQPAPMTQPNPNCNYPPPLPPTCVATAPTAIYPAPQPPLTGQTVYPAAQPFYAPVPAYAPAAVAYQPVAPSYGVPVAHTSPAIGEADRLDHILEAVHHLDAAGMQAEADHLRHECDDRLRAAIANLRTAEAQWARPRQISVDQHGPQQAPCGPTTQKTVKLQVKLMQLNVAKMRNLGFDLTAISNGHLLSSSLAPVATGNGSKKTMSGLLDVLEREEVLTTLSRPTLMTRSGERAVLHVGAQVPVASKNADGATEIAYEATGTVLEVVPTVVEDNKVHLQFHLHVSQPADASAGKLESDVQTVVVVPSGETSIISGCRSKQCPEAGEKTEVGVPAGYDYFGSRIFARDKTRENQAAPQETELLVVLQPEIVDPLAAQETKASVEKPMPEAAAADEKHDSKRVAVHVQMLELNRTKMNNLGFDFATVGFSGSGLRRVGMDNSLNCGVAQISAFSGFLKALKQEDIVKVAADPSVMTVSGRAATVFVGSEIPQISGGSTPTVEYAKIGTEINVVPIITGKDKVRLEIRGRHRTIDQEHTAQANEASGAVCPAIKTDEFDTATELASGQILVLGGSTEKRCFVTCQEIPFVSGIADAVEQLVLAVTDNEDLADTIAGFVPGRRIRTEHEEEIEHLMLVQPEIVAAGESVSKEEAQAAGQPQTNEHWMTQPRVKPPQWHPVRPTAAESPAPEEGESEQLAPKSTVPPPEPCPSNAAASPQSQCIPPATLHWSGQGELLPSAAAIHFEQLPPMGKLFDAPGEFFGIKPAGFDSFDSADQDHPSFTFSTGISR